MVLCALGESNLWPFNFGLLVDLAYQRINMSICPIRPNPTPTPTPNPSCDPDFDSNSDPESELYIVYFYLYLHACL